MGRTVPFKRLFKVDSTGPQERWKKSPPGIAQRRPRTFRQSCLCSRVRYYTRAVANAQQRLHDNPMEAILLSIALDQENHSTLWRWCVPATGVK